MQEYVLVYLGGNPPQNQESQQDHFQRYREWLKALGDRVVSPANPFRETRTIHPDGKVQDGSSVSMSGYTVIRADSLEEAVEISRSCPFLEIGGTLEVSESASMPGMYTTSAPGRVRSAPATAWGFPR